MVLIKRVSPSKIIKFVDSFNHCCMNVLLIDELIRIRKPVVTIGIYDGVHKGHRYILDHLVARASELKGESVVVTLWPHPRIVLNKDVWNFKLLLSLDEKIKQLNNAGIDNLVIVPFTSEVASLPACDFVQQYLVEKLGLHTLMLGYDNRFGRDRQGDPEGLNQCAETNNFSIEKLPELDFNMGTVSSTNIRKNLLEGKLKIAEEMLGYHYFLTGTVVAGERVGRDLGFPTANIHPTDAYKLIPLDGVYAVMVEVEGSHYQGMLNIGYRPTIDSASPVKTIEAHIIHFTGDLYDKTVTVFFIERVRDEMKFSNIEGLRNQLNEDKIEIVDILNRRLNNKPD